eukprot:6511683-Lingulodinium_polyedra.AAC.1
MRTGPGCKSRKLQQTLLSLARAIARICRRQRVLQHTQPACPRNACKHYGARAAAILHRAQTCTTIRKRANARATRRQMRAKPGAQTGAGNTNIRTPGAELGTESAEREAQSKRRTTGGATQDAHNKG